MVSKDINIANLSLKKKIKKKHTQNVKINQHTATKFAQAERKVTYDNTTYASEHLNNIESIKCF